jgi:hypothetical protein
MTAIWRQVVKICKQDRSPACKFFNREIPIPNPKILRS